MAPTSTWSDARIVEWLLQGDSSIRWQVLRDLMDAPEPEVEEVRARVASEGWGARLLSQQDASGRWAAGKSSDGGLYSPKWISTTYTMLLLRDLGLASDHPGAHLACTVLLDEGLQRDGGINYGWRGRSETCITGIVLSILSHFSFEDDRVDVVADHLLNEQMADGGWNCRQWQGATHSSVHTTILALEGLDLYQAHRTERAEEVRAACERGREFLLVHRLFRSHRTGNVIKSEFTRLHFPPGWRYDVLRALDHFQTVQAPRDERLAEAVALLRDRRHPDGRWYMRRRYRGKYHFKMERLGAASRWNTLRALRVLRWWESA